MKPSQRLKVRTMTLENTNLTLSDCSFKGLACNTYICLGILVYDSVNISHLKDLKKCFTHLVTDTCPSSVRWCYIHIIYTYNFVPAFL